MGSHYKVKQGEHLSSIAAEHGFADYRTIWDHPQNSELKERRKNPHVIHPGDELYIPERREKSFDRATEQRHRFVVLRQPLELRIKVERNYDEPFGGTEYALRVEAKRHEGMTDGAGSLKQRIDNSAANVILTLHDKLMLRGREVALDIEVPVKIGHLDPVAEPSGQRARLLNLGYYRQPVEAHDEPEFKSAIEEFQCDHDLKVDGVCGPNTEAKLVEIHGC